MFFLLSLFLWDRLNHKPWDGHHLQTHFAIWESIPHPSTVHRLFDRQSGRNFVRISLFPLRFALSTSESFSSFPEKQCSSLCKLVCDNYHNFCNLSALFSKQSSWHVKTSHWVTFPSMWSFPPALKISLFTVQLAELSKLSASCVLIRASLGHREQGYNYCYAQLIGPLGTKGWEIQDQINKQKHRIPMTYFCSCWNFSFFIPAYRQACLKGWFIRVLQEGSINLSTQSHTYLCASW